jgi:phenylalanyl-tRNA synthetase beta chain
MKVTWNWLAEFVDLALPVERLADRLTMSGLEVESVEHRGRELAAVRCAEVVEVGPHPSAERLTVCVVRSGEEGFDTVVCGAPNVAAGQRVAYAPPGAVLPGGRRLEATDIRGVTSAGMLCSAAELDVGPDDTGILVLPAAAPVGERVAAVLGIEDVVLDVAVTPNRGDCLSVLGLAREVAALTGEPLQRQRISVRETADPTASLVSVHIANPDACARYVCRVVSDLQIGPAPLWMQARLRAVGLRPINNVVDVTNYIMVERGQPLHAFDFERLGGAEIVVRRADDDAVFTTLDGQKRRLEPDDLLITAGAGPVALAGVMGGGNSEVTDNTTRVVLESAWFAPAQIRRTARRLGVRTEASYRFERSVDIEGVALAADRAAALLAELAGGSVARGRVDAYVHPYTPPPIALRLKRVDDLLGMTLPRAEVVKHLKALGMTTSPGARGTVTVVPPSYRSDLTREIDLIEEIVRLVGYENVPTTMPATALAGRSPAQDAERERAVKRALTALGLTEALLLSFCAPQVNQRFPPPAGRRAPVTVLNPMTHEDSELRLSLCPGLVRAVRDNLDQGATAVGLFTIGKVFWRADGFAEARHVAGAVCPAAPHHGLQAHVQVAEFTDAKGLLESILDLLGASDLRWERLSDHPALHPGQSAAVHIATERVGIVGRLHPDAADALGISPPCWLFELDFDAVVQYGAQRIVYKDLPRFPAVGRDLAIVTEDAFEADSVVRFAHTWAPGMRWLEDIHVFDQYVGDPIPPGKKSLTYALSYRAPDRTLTDADVNDMHARFIAALREALPIDLR